MVFDPGLGKWKGGEGPTAKENHHRWINDLERLSIPFCWLCGNKNNDSCVFGSFWIKILLEDLILSYFSSNSNVLHLFIVSVLISNSFIKLITTDMFLKCYFLLCRCSIVRLRRERGGWRKRSGNERKII